MGCLEIRERGVEVSRTVEMQIVIIGNPKLIDVDVFYILLDG